METAEARARVDRFDIRPGGLSLAGSDGLHRHAELWRLSWRVIGGSRV